MKVLIIILLILGMFQVNFNLETDRGEHKITLNFFINLAVLIILLVRGF